MSTRPAKIHDASMIAEIEKECFSDAWSEKAVEDEFENIYGAMVVYSDDDNKVIGYIIGSIDEDNAYIERIAVKEQYRKNGVAREMIDFFIESAEGTCLSLDVREANEGAIAFYKKMGFEKKAVRKNMYNNPRENGITKIYRW